VFSAISFSRLRLYLWAAGMLGYLLTLSVTLRSLQLVSPASVRKLLLRMGEKMSMTQNPRFRFEDWGPTFLSAAFIKAAFANVCLSLKQEAFVGGAAPDSPVVTMDRERTSILGFMKGGRPLVLSFGSCS
uniref:Iodothyronine deiodinase n=1 Tax=Oryzias melastigma TaxID=30732 RepID=A0A3B3D3K6_ORYME